MTLFFQDTMGYIFGSLSPDKYIVIGTSFDSMGPGASTTAHGYAVLTRVSTRAFFGHNFRDRPGPFLVFCMLIVILIAHNISKNSRFSA